MEKCQRCEEEGHDRRTLVMACFYQMSELGLPFEEDTEGRYTLRVCKSCRADWMTAIKAWFENKPLTEEDAGAGQTYVQELGANRVKPIDDILSPKDA